MHLFSIAGKRACFYRVTAALIAALLLLCSLGAGQMYAAAQGVTTFIVDTLVDGDPGSLREAINAANITAGDFEIVIAVQGTLVTATALPVLRIRNRSGWIKSNPEAVITNFSCWLEDGILTLQNVNIDNSAFAAFTILADELSKDTLFISGRNTIKGNDNELFGNIVVAQSLTIDKAPGGSDLDSTLTLSDARWGIIGATVSQDDGLMIKGGTVEARGIQYGIAAKLLITGGKVIATGGTAGIFVRAKGEDGVVEISGGTVIARGGVTDIMARARLTISGDSVNARTFGSHPTDGSGNLVYLVTVTVGDPAVANTEVTCSVNGGAPFSCITDEEGKLYLWMPAGGGAAEITIGETVYRANGTVEENYDNVMLALADPVVTGVTVTPSSATAVSGSSVQFSARVEGEHNPPQDVTWTVEKGDAGTIIDDSGLLTVSLYESSSTLLVTATSAYDPSKSGTAQVNVISATAIVLAVVLLLLFLVLLVVFLEIGIPFLRR